MKKSAFSVRDMAYCALSAALLAISAWLCFPVLQIGFTLQSFAVFFILGLLGGRRGTVSVLLYLLLGAVGLPVFSGFQGGVSVLLGVTGGYIWGFLLAALLYWALTALFGDSFPLRLTAMVLGLLLCYTCGTLWYLLAYAKGGFWAVISTCVVPYLLPDAVKLALAMSLSGRLKQVMHQAG